MTRWRPLTLVAVLGLLIAACTGAPAGASPSPEAEETAAPTEEGAAFEGLSYPEDGPVDCENRPEADDEHDAYTGNISEIRAEDEHTVVFTLCDPDVAFLSKVAFSAFAINDADYLEEHAADGSIVEEPNGTGPYRLDEWVRGDHLTLTANEDYWDAAPQAETVIFRWSAEAAQRLLELQSGQVDGIDNVGPDDFPTVEGDDNLALYEREGLNTFYVGVNRNFDPWSNDLVRQALQVGIDRERIVENFYPPGSEVATHFTPCALPFGCEGDDWPAFDQAAARDLLAQAGFPNGFETVLNYRNVVRGYLPDPVIVAEDLRAQLAEIGITAAVTEMESGAFIDASNAGELEGIFLLGWGADYPDVTNFLDFHFGQAGTPTFGDPFPEIAEPLQRGASSVDEGDRAAAYEEANNAIRELVPMVPVAHGGSATAFLADVENAHSSPLSNEVFSVMQPGDRDQLVWMQNAEPLGLFCADETDGESLRACEQINESLYAYEVGGTAPIPGLAEECVPNDDLNEWTCTLHEGVTFHDGAALDANDVVVSFALQWDVEHPLHVGRVGDFTYFSALFGGFLNPPLPEPEG